MMRADQFRIFLGTDNVLVGLMWLNHGLKKIILGQRCITVTLTHAHSSIDLVSLSTTLKVSLQYLILFNYFTVQDIFFLSLICE